MKVLLIEIEKEKKGKKTSKQIDVCVLWLVKKCEKKIYMITTNQIHVYRCYYSNYWQFYLLFNTSYNATTRQIFLFRRKASMYVLLSTEYFLVHTRFSLPRI